MIELLKGVYAVKVPVDSKMHHVAVESENNWALYFKLKGDTLGDEFQLTFLPPGNYTFLFTTKEGTFLDWAGIVSEAREFDGTNHWYRNYETGGMVKSDAIKSGHSLLRSRNLDPANNYCIIKLNT